jgi:hypothetical protein
MRTLLIAATTIALAVAAHPSTAGAKDRLCGTTARIEGVRYDVVEEKGSMACRTVRRVVTRYLRSSTTTRPWTCALEHRGRPYTASCARGRAVVVRVYALG